MAPAGCLHGVHEQAQANALDQLGARMAAWPADGAWFS